MDIKEYQEACMVFARYRREDETPQDEMLDHPVYLMYHGLSLASEAGEVAGELSKAIRDDSLLLTSNDLTPSRREKVILEMGDTFWHLSVMCKEMGITLEELATSNIEKLTVRYAEKLAKEKEEATEE